MHASRPVSYTHLDVYKRQGERNLQCSEMQSRAHELITATVVSVDHERGNIVLDLGKGGSAVLPRNEQVPGESFNEGDTVQVYVVDVLATDRGPRVTISRTHPGPVSYTHLPLMQLAGQDLLLDLPRDLRVDRLLSAVG